MTLKFAVLMVAAVVLSACGSISTDDAGPTKSAKQRLVTRGAIVPDDPVPSVKPKKARTIKKASTVAVADASSAVPVETPSTPVETPRVPDRTTAPMVAPSTSGSSGGGTDGGGTPVVTEPSTIVADGSTTPTAPSPSDVTTTPLAPVEPSTVTAEPVGAPTPTPSPLAIDFRDMLNTTIAGFPLWLMVVVGILLAAALVFGTGGGRRERAPERDYRDDREPDYDDRSYAARHDDAEPEPA